MRKSDDPSDGFVKLWFEFLLYGISIAAIGALFKYAISGSNEVPFRVLAVVGILTTICLGGILLGLIRRPRK